MIYSLIMCTFCIYAGSAHAQQITEEQQIKFERRVKQTIEEFHVYLSNITNNQLRKDIREECMENLLNLFLGRGEPFDYYEGETNKRIHCSGVKISILGTNHPTSRTQLLKRYLYKLYNPQTGATASSYSQISIDAVDIIKIENIQKVDEHYECVACYTQKYVGFRDGRAVKTDIILKKIKCYLGVNPEITLPTGETIFPVKLGDIYAVTNKN